MKLPTSIFVKDRLPQHIVDNNPLFAAFAEAYYEWVDQQDEASGASKGVIELRDIDDTIDSFVNFLIKEILNVEAPEVAMDKRLFLKHLQNLFSSKGSEKSFRLFFKMFYDVDIKVLYPSENILRASDGEWQETLVLTTDKISGNIENLPGTLIYGQTSGAVAGVETIETFFIGGEEKYLIKFNDSYSGQFIADEHIKSLIGTDNELDFIINKTVQKIEIISNGLNYAIGDNVIINSASGSGARGYVSNVSPPKLIKLKAEYSKNGTTVSIDCADKYHLLSIGDSLFLNFKSGIQSGNYTVSNIVSDFIFQIEVNPPEIIVADRVDVYNAKESGAILNISILDGGFGYLDATFEIISDIGSGAILQGVFGAYSKLPGIWTSNKGIISNSLSVLQDNLRYQQFSYVIQSSESIIRWRDLFKKLVHPAGMGVFSETIISLEGSIPAKVDSTEYVVVTNDEIDASLTSIEIHYAIIAHQSAEATGYTNLEYLKSVINDLPPVTTEEQYNVDLRDMIYEGRSNHNYDGTKNAGYWGYITKFDTDITFGSMPFAANPFSGYLLKFNYKSRNFRPEEFYTQEEIDAGVMIDNKVIAIPDSCIKIIKIVEDPGTLSPPEINWPFPPV